MASDDFASTKSCIISRLVFSTNLQRIRTLMIRCLGIDICWTTHHITDISFPTPQSKESSDNALNGELVVAQDIVSN